MVLEHDLNRLLSSYAGPTMSADLESLSKVDVSTNLTNPIEGTTLTLPITDDKLNGQNFIQWERLVHIFPQGKGKEGYIMGWYIA